MNKPGMNRPATAKVPESRLTSGLSVVYRYGYSGALILMLIGLLFPLAGWSPAEAVLKAGILLLLCIPVVSALWVGYEALHGRDRRLLSVVAGIILLLMLAGLLANLQ